MTTRTEPGAGYRVTFPRVVRSEWGKLGSLRATWLGLGATVLLTVGMAAAFGWGYGGQVRAGEAERSGAAAVEAAFLGLDLFALVVGVLGVLQMSGEFGSGLIRATFAAVPRRLPVLAAKALTLAALTVPVTLVTCVAAFLAGQVLAGDQGASLGDPGVAGAVAGAAGYPVAMALMGLGFGALLRHTAGAITTLVTTLLVVPALLPAMLTERWEDNLVPFLPVVAGQALYLPAGGGPFETLSRPASALVLAGWVLLLLGAGTVLLRRRDA